MGNKIYDDYLVGIDLGTNSLGWAVTDLDFNLVKIDGKELWGSRLFPEASDAKNRRSRRTSRKRLARRRYRIVMLRELFAHEIDKVDPGFFERLDMSSFYEWHDPIAKDRPIKKNSLFDDPGFTDKDYKKKYPTIYHLRRDLCNSTDRFDIRLVYLALHHLIKYRGNFLDPNELGDDGSDSFKSIDAEDIKGAFDRIDEAIRASLDDDALEEADEYCFNVDKEKAESVLKIIKSVFGFTDTKDQLTKALFSDRKKPNKQQTAIIKLISGGKVKAVDVFNDADFSDDDLKDLELDDWDDKIEDKIDGMDEDESSILLNSKIVYDAHEFLHILGDNSSISDAMIARYETHKKQLGSFLGKASKDGEIHGLKDYVKRYNPDCYKDIFGVTSAKDKIHNYTNYVKHNLVDGVKQARYPNLKFSAKDFYKFLDSKLNISGTVSSLKKKIENSELQGSELEEAQKRLKYLENIQSLMEKDEFLPKLRTSENGVIKHQFHEAELLKIIKNQGKYYPFLLDKDDEGNYKILDIFLFKIPYYIGPLDNNENNKNSWARKNPLWAGKNEKITPWNFMKYIDEESTAAEFIKRMQSSCSYLIGAKNLLPRKSLLFTEYTVLNEINKLQLVDSRNDEGRYLNQEEKEALLSLYKEKGKPSKKELQEKCNEFKDFIPGMKLMVVSTADGTAHFSELTNEYLRSDMKPWADFQRILGRKLRNPESENEIESLIETVTTFEDSKIRAKTINKICDASEELKKLTPEQRREICNLSYKGWATLSRDLLTKHFCMPDGTFNEHTVIEEMRKVHTRELKNGKTEIFSQNFMEVINDPEYRFKDGIDEENEDAGKNISDYKAFVKESYGSPMIKRSIVQGMKVIKELQDILDKDSRSRGHVAVIKRIYVESPRESNSLLLRKKKKKVPDSRFKHLLAMYENAATKTANESNEYIKSWLSQKNKELNKYKDDPQKLDQKKLLHYFLQLGKDVYTGENIDLATLLTKDSIYDLDHIIPRAKCKDDSIENMVLVSKAKNNDKSDYYPIPKGIITEKGRKVINSLRALGLMSETQYKRLTRQPSKPLTEEELMGFVNRQLVSTAQSCKALKDVILFDYRKSDREVPDVLFPNAENASMFRQIFFIPKCREINDYHHAQDALINVVVGECLKCYFGDQYLTKKNFDSMFDTQHIINSSEEDEDDLSAEEIQKKEYREKSLNLRKIFLRPIFRNFFDKSQGLVWTKPLNFIRYSEDEKKGVIIPGSTLDRVKKEVDFQPAGQGAERHTAPLLSFMPYGQTHQLNNDTIVSPKLSKASPDGKKKEDSAYSEFTALKSPSENKKCDPRFALLHDVEKYGHFTPLSVYYKLVESDEKKGKKKYSLIPVNFGIENRSAKEPGLMTRYLESDFGLKNPKILLDKVLLNAVVEYQYEENGKILKIPYLLRGKYSIGRNYVRNFRQPFFTAHETEMFKLLSKFDAIVSGQAKKDISEIEISDDLIKLSDGKNKDVFGVSHPQVISRTDLEDLYSALSERFTKKIFARKKSFDKSEVCTALETCKDSISKAGMKDLAKLCLDLVCYLAGNSKVGNLDFSGITSGIKKIDGRNYLSSALPPMTRILYYSTTGFYKSVVFKVDKDGKGILNPKYAKHSDHLSKQPDGD